jgi:hypothetical protein
MHQLSRHANGAKEKPKTPDGQFAPFSHMAGQVLQKIALSLLCVREYHKAHHAPATLWHMCNIKTVEGC